MSRVIKPKTKSRMTPSEMYEKFKSSIRKSKVFELNETESIIRHGIMFIVFRWYVDTWKSAAHISVALNPKKPNSFTLYVYNYALNQVYFNNTVLPIHLYNIKELKKYLNEHIR